MKHWLPEIMLVTVICVLSCGPSQKTVKDRGIEVVPDGAQIDSADYFDDQYTITRLINKKELDGKWIVTRMFRERKNPPENLKDVTLSFADSSFAGNAPCNSIAGDIVIIGTYVKFKNIISTEMACEKLEQEKEFLQLLQNSVSVLTLKEDKLLLRDRAGNNVFECVKDR
jgi:heat shock protein HslJ